MRISTFARFVPLFVLLCLTFPACDGPQDDNSDKPGASASASEGIEAYTTGMIGRQESVYVMFTSAPGTAAAELIQITPTTQGKATLNGNTLAFQPATGWAPATTYTARVSVAGANDFTFTFSTPARRAEVISEGVFIPADAKGEVQVTGRVVTNDAATTQEIRNIFSARQGKKAIDVEVATDGDERHFTYRISVPNRGANPDPVVISTVTTGKSGFVTTGAGITVPIPSDDDFRVESLVVADEAENTLLARFSAALETGQDLSGLIRFPNNTRYTTRTEGNLLYIYPQGDNLGNIAVELSDGIRNNAGKRLGRETTWQVNLGRTQPDLRRVGEGSIMPHQGKRLFTFEAVGLKAVRLEVYRIFSGNVGQYLQDNSLSSTGSDWSLRHVGKIITQERVELSSISDAVNSSRWTRYALDLDKYLEEDAAAIYQIRLGFGMEDAVAGCTVGPADFSAQPLTEDTDDDFSVGFRERETMMGDYYGIHGSYADFSWEERDNPCVPAYYNRDRFLTQNVLSSNLGLIAKRNPDRSTVVFATDLRNAAPFPGTRVRAYSAQRQEVFSGTTDGEGRVRMTTNEEPALIVADVGQDAAYLALDGNTALSMSRYATEGVQSAGGIKGAFYAERGVWRPGDSVFLNFVLEDRARRLPKNYPVTFTLADARGRTVATRTVTPAFNRGFYPLAFATQQKDPTGNWTARIEAGGKTYTHNLMIETVKPNRLSIDLELPAAGLSAANPRVTLVSQWLYGAPASKLRATVEATLSGRRPNFPAWGGFDFTDPARRLNQGQATEVFSGELNEAGRASFAVPLGNDQLPGPVTAGISTKVFEEGGNFSIDNQRISVDPYAVYAGVNVPLDEWGSRRVGMEQPTRVRVASVDPRGEPVANRKLTAGLYRLSWRYWWQDNYDNVARFNSSSHTEALQQFNAVTGADGAATLSVQAGEWGRYLLRVCDEGGHCAGQYFYAGYNTEQADDRESASLLRPVADREEVNVGQAVTVKLPTSAGGRMLVSLETSAGSIEQFWVDADAGQTSFSFDTDARMVPTVYANITLLQPYEQTTNDRPVRLYGLVPITVTDPATVLNPEIITAEEWRPQQRVNVKVREAGGQPMTYTVAVVDEGLLGLTRFQTPDLHDRFFAKEALSVRTFDLYKYVLGSLNGEFGKVLAIGGGDEVAEEDQTANRFEPVVRHLGPFRLAAGQTASHEIELPNYVGAVRTMVVASGDRAYGSAAERIPVVQPLMLLPTLPRVLGPGERVDMPVNVFAMKDNVRNVRLDVTEESGLASISDPRPAVNFSKVGNQTTYVPVQVGDRTGVARFRIAGAGNGASASQEIEIDVRQPNEEVSRSSVVTLAPGERKTVAYENFGVVGSRGAQLELSALPAMQLGRHLRYLLRYPYGCVEQTVSPAFAQVFLDQVTELTPLQESQRKTNVMAGLEKLRNFQTSTGGMAYWPGGRQPHPWATSYALHFLTEAERAGFAVPVNLRSSLLKFQARAANNWREGGENFYASAAQLRRDQAYRLYTLALAGQPEMGAMNRLRGRVGELPAAAAYQLAAAYALAGQAKTSTDLMAAAPTVVKPYRELGYTFGSDVRDMAMILEAQLAAKDQAAASKQAFRLAERVGKQSWLSTQEAAFAIVAIGKISATDGQEISANLTAPGGGRNAVGATTGVYNVDLPTDGTGASFTLENTGQVTLYATVVTSGKPSPGNEKVINENLVLDVEYTDAEGRAVDVTNLRSGTDFIANYTVRNPGSLGMSYQQLALRTLLPSGWEVSNERLSATNDGDDGGTYDYRDIRDDRVYTFFDLGRGQSKTFAFRMTATYPGRYYLPGQAAEAMYANDIQAGTKGQWVEVRR